LRECNIAKDLITPTQTVDVSGPITRWTGEVDQHSTVREWVGESSCYGGGEVGACQRCECNSNATVDACAGVDAGCEAGLQAGGDCGGEVLRGALDSVGAVGGDEVDCVVGGGAA
jgi:hypothetical protein